MSRRGGFCGTCQELGALVGGSAMCTGTVCSLSVDRTNLNPTILGRPLRAEGIVDVSVNVERPDRRGRALITLEATLLQEEVARFIRVMQKFGIEVTALHNHWFYDRPRLMYVHAQAITDPFLFAEAVVVANEKLIVPPRFRTTTST